MCHSAKPLALFGTIVSILATKLIELILVVIPNNKSNIFVLWKSSGTNVNVSVNTRYCRSTLYEKLNYKLPREFEQ
jgi:hypothetical protein